MTGRTHLVGGLTAGLLVAHWAGVQGSLEIAACVAAGGVGGLLPDIDHPKSMISGWLPGSGLLRLAISHRGPTHTLIFILAVLIGLMAVPVQHLILASLASGMVLHILCDMGTPQGVRLFMPLSRGAWHLVPGELIALPGVAWAFETMVGASMMMLSGAILIGVV